MSSKFSHLNTLDSSGMQHHLLHFPEQLKKAYDIGKKATIPDELSFIKNIVCVGMGGSAIGSEIISNYLWHTLCIPISINRNYTIPSFIDNNSLVYITSYSGNTEETLAAYDRMSERGAKIICCASGGTLAEKARADGVPLVLVPGGQPPRTALGYLAIPLLAIFSKLKFIPNQDEAFNELIEVMSKLAVIYAPASPQEENSAKQLAAQLHGTLPIVYSSTEHLTAVGTRWRNQFSENSKTLAFSNQIPELCHNEIVGWSDTFAAHINKMQVVFLRDSDELPQVHQRIEIVKEIIAKKSKPPIEVHSRGKSLLARIFSLVYLGDWASYYLAILNAVNPTPIENIRILKERLQMANK